MNYGTRSAILCFWKLSSYIKQIFLWQWKPSNLGGLLLCSVCWIDQSPSRDMVQSECSVCSGLTMFMTHTSALFECQLITLSLVLQRVVYSDRSILPEMCHNIWPFYHIFDMISCGLAAMSCKGLSKRTGLEKIKKRVCVVWVCVLCFCYSETCILSRSVQA